MVFERHFLNRLWHIWESYDKISGCQWIIIVIGLTAVLETRSKSLLLTAVLLPAAKWNSLFHKTRQESQQTETEEEASVVCFAFTVSLFRFLIDIYLRGSPEKGEVDKGR